MKYGIWAMGLAGAAACGIGDPTGDSSAPLIEITAPRLSVVSGNVDFSASVLDDTGVARVRFLADGNVLLVDTEAPYLTNWDTTDGVSEGPHTLSVEATDLAGNSAAVSKVVTVNNGTPNLRGNPGQR